MQRLEPDLLRLTGGDAVLLIDSLSLYDVLRLPTAFAPAKRYVSALGALLRTYRDAEAWIRETSFELTINAMELKGDKAVLNYFERLIRARSISRPSLGVSLIFNYQHKDEETEEPKYDSTELKTLNCKELHVLLEIDAVGGRIMDRHAKALDNSFYEFFRQWVDDPLQVKTIYSFEPYGLSYDRSLAKYADLRAPEEAPPVARRGLSGLLYRDGRHKKGISIVLDEGNAIRNFLASWLSNGAVIVRDAELGNERYALVIVAPDGGSALGLHRGSHGWHLGRAQIIDRVRLLGYLNAENKLIDVHDIE